MENGAIVQVEVLEGNHPDTKALSEPVACAVEVVNRIVANERDGVVRSLTADKGYFAIEEIAQIRWQRQLRYWLLPRKALENRAAPKVKDTAKLGTNERERQVTDWRKRQCVKHPVPHARPARLQLFKSVPMNPFAIRTFQLFVDKLARRIPRTNPRPPAHRQSVEQNPVVNQRSFLHPGGHLRQNLKSKRWRSQSDEICGIGEKGKDVVSRSRNRGLRLEKMFAHQCLYVRETRLDQLSGLSRDSISRLRCSRNGGSERLSPRVSSDSSAVKPGSSVAISKSMPFGSRK